MSQTLDDNVTTEVVAEPVLDAAPPAPAKPKRSIAAIVGPLCVLAFFVGVWYFVSLVVLEPRRQFLLPPPHEALYVSFIDGVTLGGLAEVGKRVLSDLIPLTTINFDIDSSVVLLDNLSALWATIKVAVVGLIEAILFGTAAAVLMSQARWLERSLYPWLLALMATPILAIAPLIGAWFGYGFNPRTMVVLIISFFPIANNTLFGLQSAEEGQRDLFTLHGASRMTRLTKLQFPSAMPAFFLALRNAAGLAVIGSIVGDFVFGRGDVGIGGRLQKYAARLDYAELFGALILSTLLGVTFYLVFDWIGQRAIGKWHGVRDR